MSPGLSRSEEKVKGSIDSSVDHSLERGAEGETPPLRNYIFLTIFTCFCPAWPINIVALVFSIMSQSSYDNEDYDGAHRLGRKALHMGIASFIIGIIIIMIFCIVHFTTAAGETLNFPLKPLPLDAAKIPLDPGQHKMVKLKQKE